jgi:DNA-binding SARP family transcriptional activator
MTPLHLTLLGAFGARGEDGRVVSVRRRKARALLAYLALSAGVPQSREKLIALLWGEADPGHARHSLRQALTVLRRDLASWGTSGLVLAGDTVRLEPGLVTVDAITFERLAGSSATTDLEHAAVLYRGDLLEGLDRIGEAFETWLMTERDRLRIRAVKVLDRLLALRMAEGATAEAVEVALRLLGVDPFREDVHRLLMRLHLGEGRRSSALRQYRTCESLLRRELDVSPDRETTELYQAIVGRRAMPATIERQTVRLHRLAAEGAIYRSAFPEAVACLEQALEAIEHVAAGRRRLSAALDVRLDFEAALLPLGEVDRLREYLREARAEAQALGDRRRLPWVAAQGMSCDLWSGAASAAAEVGERILAAPAASGDAKVRLGVACRLAQAYYYLGDFQRAAQIAAALVAARPREDLSPIGGPQGVPPAVHCRTYLALSLTALGDFAAGREAALEAVRLAERVAHAWTLAFARCGLGTTDLQQGRPREASDSFAIAQALERGETGALRFLLPGSPIGSAYALGGRREEGIALIESAARTFATGSLGTFRVRSLSTLGRLRLGQGRLDEAHAHAQEALRLARLQRERASEGWLLWLLAEILSRTETRPGAGQSQALSVCLDALARAEALGMRPLVARCQEMLGDLWERAGDTERARAAREAGIELCQALGLPARNAIFTTAAVHPGASLPARV